MIFKVIYESNHIFLLSDSTASNALNFCFFIYFVVIWKKKDHTRRKIKIKKVFICEIGITIINLICRKLESVGLLQQKIKLPLLYDDLNKLRLFMTETWSLVWIRLLSDQERLWKMCRLVNFKSTSRSKFLIIWSRTVNAQWQEKYLPIWWWSQTMLFQMQKIRVILGSIAY